MTSPIAQHGAVIAPLMRRAGFRYVFLGIENILEEDLGFLKAKDGTVKDWDGNNAPAPSDF